MTHHRYFFILFTVCSVLVKGEKDTDRNINQLFLFRNFVRIRNKLQRHFNENLKLYKQFSLQVKKRLFDSWR